MRVAVILMCALAIGPVGAETMAWEAETLPGVGLRDESTWNASASGGAYAFLPEANKTPGAEGQSSLTLNVEAEAGAYRLRIRALAVSGGADSFFVMVNGRSKTVNFREAKAWDWRETDFMLTMSGKHSIVFAAREVSRIDAIELVKISEGEMVFAIRQSEAVLPEPNGSRPLDINPPTLRWPGDWKRTYTIELAAKGFEWKDGVSFKDIGDTFYRPLKPLAPGKYRWRVMVDGKPWSDVASFTVDHKTARWEIPPWDETYARFPREHPRVFIRADQVDTIRARSKGELAGLFKAMVEHNERAIGKKLRLEQDKDVPEVADARERTMRRVTSKSDTKDLMQSAGRLALLGFLLDRDDLADEAIRRTMIATRLDPSGFTSHGISDFANGTIVAQAGMVYDYLYDRLTDEQRRAIREMILARMFQYRPKLEQRLYGAHCWQHVFLDVACGALAIWDEDERAEEWLKWSARMFVAHYPWYGGADGGSAEGANYYKGTNLYPSLHTLLFWESAAGLDLKSNPWFKANPYFMIYSHPPGGPLSGFADSGSRDVEPDAKKASAALLMANLYVDPQVAGYAQAIAPELSDKELVEKSATSLIAENWMVWDLLGRVKAKPLGELPPARVFRDVGVGYLHTAIDDPSRNVMFEFRSSPYGSFNHAHADANSFNIAAFGEYLIVDSGYYTSYGDPHHYGWTVTQKAHNTITVDGEEQPSRNLDAYGKIVGFKQGDGWMWIAGQASTAYRTPAIESFLRQVVWMRSIMGREVFLIHDTIRAADGKPHRFEWRLHTAHEPQIASMRKRLTVVGERGQAVVSWLEPRSVNFDVSNEFVPPAENWRSDRGERDYSNQWHTTVTPKTAAVEQTFITEIKVADARDRSIARPSYLRKDGFLMVAPYELKFLSNGVDIQLMGEPVGRCRIDVEH